MAIDLTDYSRTAAQRGWGAGWPSCAAAGRMVVVTADRSGTRISVHERIARLIDLLIDWTEHPLGGNYLLEPGQCGGWNCRPIAGTSTSSNHAWGLAVDINWQENTYNTTGQHTIPTAVARMWNRFGFAWGGNYRSAAKDWMHFEAMGTPAEMDAMTALAMKELGAPPDPSPRSSTTDSRRPEQEDSAVFIETPPPASWQVPKDGWPARRVSVGFDPPGGWGGRCALKLHWGAPGGWVHEAKWWVRPGTGVGEPNKPHSPVAINTAPIAERFVGMGWELIPPERADELEIVISAPAGCHIFPVYER